MDTGDAHVLGDRPADSQPDSDAERKKLQVLKDISIKRDRIEAQFSREIHDKIATFENFRMRALDEWLRQAALELPKDAAMEVNQDIQRKFHCYVESLRYQGRCPDPSLKITFSNTLPPTPLFIDSPVEPQRQDVQTTHISPIEQPQLRANTTPGDEAVITKERVQKPRGRKPGNSKKKILKAKSQKQDTGTITNNQVGRSRLWAFAVESDGHVCLYTLRCPAVGCGHVFSQDPFEEDRAETHFRNCGVSFEDKEDIVKRYARRIVSQDPEKRMKADWAKRHNALLLAGHGRDGKRRSQEDGAGNGAQQL
ncbi:hypothetical protein CkaCkLH20_03749 [Colletotrichum karsti]|uniref:Uncharacterized protein n=1 Tax=Colletotrichum karsti TaxID=1095194 RepID=A0A9P6LJY9_9PEZI|nr:uncharacterized protein CkaCkLH20_03749 [Colletotrichum karsti]KAF9878849.1 hypothetical protein CkaCkLH20_03749 [Colletotrichum karsti]